MWKDLDQEQMAEGEHAYSTPRSPEDVEAIVVMVRLERYNRNQPCGADALRKRLNAFYHLKPLPSARKIGRILARHGLTHQRTGRYPGEDN
jgi:putative transposase